MRFRGEDSHQQRGRGAMSALHGDKARFNRERKDKLARTQPSPAEEGEDEPLSAPGDFTVIG